MHLPKTINPERMLEKLDADCIISEADMKFLDGLKETVPKEFRSKPDVFWV